MEETMSYQETISQLSCFAPVDAFDHYLPNPDPELIAKDIEENWEYCRTYHKTEDWSALDQRALEDYVQELVERIKEIHSKD